MQSKKFQLLLVSATSCLLGLIFIAILVVAYFSRNLPSMDAIKNYQPLLVSTVYSATGEVVGEYSLERRKTLAQIPKNLQHAFVAAEDEEFFRHHGINPITILRAAYKNLLAGHAVQGGSTITQQVAKSILLSPEKSLDRKVKEMLLAFKIEKALNKEEILNLYLNHIFLGQGAYGVEAAARTYFGKSAEELNVPEAAILAGLPRAPSRDNPVVNPSAAKQRQLYVLGRMLAANFITKSEYDSGINTIVKIYDHKDPTTSVAPYFTEHVRRYLIKKYGESMVYGGGLKVYTTVNLKAQVAAQEALRVGLLEVDKRIGFRRPQKNLKTLEEKKSFLDKQHNELLRTFFGYRELNTQGKLINPGTDDHLTPLELKKTYEAVLIGKDSRNRSLIVQVGNRKGFIRPLDYAWTTRAHNSEIYTEKVIRNPYIELEQGDLISVQSKTLSKEDSTFILEQAPLIEGAVLSYNIPDGSLAAMVGGFDFSKSEFNRAVQATRQPGSAFKPIIYGAAIEAGLTPSTIVVDSPIVYKDQGEQNQIEKVWRPDNFSNHFYGDTSLRNALTYSRNIPSIKLVQHLKVSAVVDFARKMGIHSPLNSDLTLALGGSAVNMEELLGAVGIYANKGKKLTAHFISKIEDRNGNILEEYTPPEKIENIVKESTAFLMTSLLRDVVERGTATTVLPLGRPAAGKTGTTNDFKDAWFVGYVPQMITGVWVGFDEDRTIGPNETGGEAAAPIWLSYMKRALDGLPVTEFEVPPSIVQVQVDPETGDVPTARTKKRHFEYFENGTAPGQIPLDAEGKPIADAKPNRTLVITGNGEVASSSKSPSNESSEPEEPQENLRDDL